MIGEHKSFEACCKERAVRWLERVVSLIKKNAPEVIIDRVFALAEVAVISLCGEYGLRRRAKKIRERFAVDTGWCKLCYKKYAQQGNDVCAECETSCEALAKEAEKYEANERGDAPPEA